VSTENYDDFDDVINGTAGVFDASGLSDHDTVKTKIGQNGVLVECSCRKCGAPASMLMDYGELIAIAHDVSPQAAYGPQYPQVVRQPTMWKFSEANGAWYPDVACGRCRGWIAPMVDVTEARDHVMSAKTRGWVNEQAVARLSQAAMVARQSGRR